MARGLAAYARGDFYLAHEELEPAWMAATDPGERELLGGLIKLAAAFVHATPRQPGRRADEPRAGHGNAWRAPRRPAATAGSTSRRCWRRSTTGSRGSRPSRRRAAEAAATRRLPVPDPPHDVAGPPGRARRPPLALEPPTLARRSPA